ncbi:MAG: FAD-NAD(P)-binding protein, partial [Enterobacter sp.]|nr:FAD-NAD(P)-binding protein [Enterobacter sp.]
DIGSDQTVITTKEKRYRFDVFIDARGQKPLRNKDIPFPTLRKQLEETGDEIPDVGEDYTLLSPASLRGRIAFGAIPWLMHDHPFVQGLSECAEIGKAMAKAAGNPASGVRRKLPFMEF